jgi:hypothetical protein
MYTKTTGFKKGDNLSIGCIAQNASGNSTQVNSTVKTISNSLPTVASTLTTTGSPYIYTLMTCSASGATDADNDTLTYLYKWYSGATVLSTTSNLTVPALEGSTFYCNVTTNDGTSNSSTTKVSQTFTITQTPPVVNGITCPPNDNGLCTVMRSGGAGLGVFMQYMVTSLPGLMIILVLVGIITSVGLGIALIIKHSLTKEE